GPANCDLHSVVDANGMAGAAPLYKPTVAGVGAGSLTTKEMGDFAVNTIQPPFQPYAPGTPPGKRLPPVVTPNIGDRLNDAGVSWAWYGGGWANAAGRKDSDGWTNGQGPACADPEARADSAYPNCPDTRFQFHHQPFNYFAAFGDDTASHRANRADHLKDEADFLTDLRHGDLPAVSFVKPLGTENAHPGYTSQVEGDRHVVELLRAIQADSEDWPTTAVVLTYDEFGGTADHVPPPRHGPTADQWGPGTRIPAMIVSPLLAKDRGVDSTAHDTTSIVATIEKRFGLAPLATRDQAVADFSAAFRR
ncbi:MAG: phosphoesterase, partial [Actinobacteria bacterium]|nr:phosphoesterase [Actinomycetota bacterium]